MNAIIDVNLFNQRNPVGSPVRIATPDPRGERIFGKTIITEPAYAMGRIPVIKVNIISWPIPIRWIVPERASWPREVKS